MQHRDCDLCTVVAVICALIVHCEETSAGRPGARVCCYCFTVHTPTTQPKHTSWRMNPWSMDPNILQKQANTPSNILQKRSKHTRNIKPPNVPQIFCRQYFMRERCVLVILDLLILFHTLKSKRSYVGRI